MFFDSRHVFNRWCILHIFVGAFSNFCYRGDKVLPHSLSMTISMTVQLSDCIPFNEGGDRALAGHLVTEKYFICSSLDSTDLNITRTVAALVGKAFSTCAINVMILYTAEVYPTILRCGSYH